MADLVVNIHLPHLWLHALPLLLFQFFTIFLLNVGLRVQQNIWITISDYQVTLMDNVTVFLEIKRDLISQPKKKKVSYVTLYLANFFNSSSSNEIRKLKWLLFDTTLSLQNNKFLRKIQNTWKIVCSLQYIILIQPVISEHFKVM